MVLGKPTTTKVKAKPLPHQRRPNKSQTYPSISSHTIPLSAFPLSLDRHLQVRPRFNHLHLTSVPDAKERYGNEIRRVVATLDSILKQRDWLVGDKCTWADLAWVPWNVGIDFALAKDKGGPVKFSEDEFPAYKGWMERMRAKESVKKVLAMPR